MSSTEEVSSKCKSRQIDFIAVEDNPEALVIEDDIRADLAKIGVNVTTKYVDAEGYIDAEREGTYNLLFTKTWGAPYDPHSYLESWELPSHVEYSASSGLEPPLTREELFKKIEEVQSELNPTEIQKKYDVILNDIHKQAMFLPLYGVRTPYIINRRLDGFSPSPQTYSYPISNLRVASGSTTVTVAPGTGGALFRNVGPIHAHQYSPNQLFAQDWVYEGLLSYGQDGTILPALAESWVEEKLEGGGQRVNFTLRKNVKFHDGTDFNCAAAKLNFDHVLEDTVRQRHSWFGTPQHLSKWYCESEKFILETSKPYYPLLQELTYIRPLVFASPSAFHKGLSSHPNDHNSCNPGQFGTKWEDLEKNVTCKGLSKPIGTGPFKYISTEPHPADSSIDGIVTFERHTEYWGAVPEIETVRVEYYNSTDEVKAALLSGKLDMALGVGPLTATDIQDLMLNHKDTVAVRHSDVQQHAALIMNTGRAPTDNIEFRKAVIHAIDKGTFIKREFADLEQPVSELIPKTAPYCNVDLNPKWSYDFQKAKLLNCPDGNSLSAGAISGIVIAVIFVVSLISGIFYMIRRERRGKPIFSLRDEENVGFSS